MTVAYKTSASDAANMAAQWYALAGVQNPSAKAIAWWTKQIQQDGSHTAFLNFSNGKGQDSQSQFNPQTLVQNVAAQTQQTGLPPWTPASGAVNGQLPGTNTKSGGAIIGSALTSPVGKVIEGVVAGALDVVTGGAATPLTTAGLAALQGGGAALQPGSNFGSIAGGALGGAAEGALAGTGASLLNSATGGALATASAVPNAATMNAGTLANVANADATVAPASIGLPGASTVAQGLATAKGIASAVNPSTGLPQPSSVNPPGGGSDLTSLLNGLGTTIPALAGAANAANLQGQSQQYAQDALATQEANWNQEAPLRTAGIAGLLNPSTPAPGVANLAALNTAASKGNPFATAVPLPSPSAVNSTAPVASGTTTPPTTGLPTPSPLGTQPPVPPLPVSVLPKPPLSTGLPTPSAVGAPAGGSSGTPSSSTFY